MINRERMKKHGLTEEQIDRIDAYFEKQEAEGGLDLRAVPIMVNGKLEVVCATVAEALCLFAEDQVIIPTIV